MLNKKVQELDNVSMAYDIIEDVFATTSNAILSTSFGHYSAVLLKMVTDVAPGTAVVWVDTGYNTTGTYLHCEQLCDLLSLNLHSYHPHRSVTHRSALGPNPIPGENGYDEFVDEIKLEPFMRALNALEPTHWITGIRGEETEHRRTLGTESDGPNGIKKVAPLFHWSEADLINFMSMHELPYPKDYQDLAKPDADQECGLHCRL